MGTSFGALCNDFYISHKLAVKMDLPYDREAVLHLFDRIGKELPDMEKFHRYGHELLLESARRDESHRWLALRQNAIRTGHANPMSMAEGYRLHQLMMNLLPYHLSISPLDIDYLELTLGFELECKANQDKVVAEALFADSPLNDLLGLPDASLLSTQPIFNMALSESGDRQVSFEIKTRQRGRRGSTKRYRSDPISLSLSLRLYSPVKHAKDLLTISNELADQAENLAMDRLIPHLLTPIARQITSNNT